MNCDYSEGKKNFYDVESITVDNAEWEHRLNLINTTVIFLNNY